MVVILDKTEETNEMPKMESGMLSCRGAYSSEENREMMLTSPTSHHITSHHITSHHITSHHHYSTNIARDQEILSYITGERRCSSPILHGSHRLLLYGDEGAQGSPNLEMEG